MSSEALAAGIPVITSGVLLMDQRFWANRVYELGMGPQAIGIGELSNPTRPDTQMQFLMKRALCGTAWVHPDSFSADNTLPVLEDSAEKPWSWNARDVFDRLEAVGDGVRENALEVYQLGVGESQKLASLPIVEDAFKSYGCVGGTAKQCRCLTMCLLQSVFCCVVFQLGGIWMCLCVALWRCITCRCCRRKKAKGGGEVASSKSWRQSSLVGQATKMGETETCRISRE